MLLAAIFFISIAVTNAKQCYNDTKEPYVLMNSKTAYEFVHDNSIINNYPGCKAKQFWLLSRHGTRYPSAKAIGKMLKNGPKLQKKILEEKDSNLCKADLDNLKAWQINITESDENLLTSQGVQDLFQMARRFQNRFPELLDVPYHCDLFKFRSTNTSRTLKSALAFADGLFGVPAVYIPETIDPDPLLQSYDNCRKWRENVDENPETEAEKDSFIDKTEVQEVVEDVNERLGLSSLDYDDIDLMYELCRYEKAWTPTKLSPWCAVFKKEDLKVLEYVGDLKYYYGESYGNDLNVKLGCAPINDFLKRFSDIVDNVTQPLGVFYFAHSTTINMVLARLGLFKDITPPTSSNYEQVKDRLWRSSLIGSFASNIAAAFYECGDGERHRVQLFVSERPVLLEGCAEELCSWEHVKQQFADITNQCDMSFCLN